MPNAARCGTKLGGMQYLLVGVLGLRFSHSREIHRMDVLPAVICLIAGTTQETPDTAYQPSPRPMPTKLPGLEYPDRFEVRYVSANGGIRWNKQWVKVSSTRIGEYIGLEGIDDGVWNV